MQSTNPSTPTGRPAFSAGEYLKRLRLFRPNARLYLLSLAIGGVSFGIYSLLLNFYILSLGFDEALIGGMLTISNVVTLAGAIPAGALADRLGRKPSLVWATLLSSLAVAGLVFLRTPIAFYLMSALLGIGQTLGAVTSGPFLMENSGEADRTYLFSFSAAIQMMASVLGNWLGGRMPAWLGMAEGVPATSASAYGWSLAIVVGISAVGMLPLLLLKRQRTARQAGEPTLTPFQYAKRHPALLVKLISPMLITSLGAGLLIPFMNLFFRRAYAQTDASIGTLFASGSLAMGIGLLLAPPLAERWGKIRLVVISQALSIPFLALLGFAPWFWLSAFGYLARLALMNMSGPIYQAYVMEQVGREARATVASLVSMSWSFGWAFSPTISGWLQVRYGFDPIYVGTITTYVLAIFLTWHFFWPRPTPSISGPLAGKRVSLPD